MRGYGFIYGEMSNFCGRRERRTFSRIFHLLKMRDVRILLFLTTIPFHLNFYVKMSIIEKKCELIALLTV